MGAKNLTCYEAEELFVHKTGLAKISSRIFNVAAAFVLTVASVPLTTLLVPSSAHAYGSDAFVIEIDTTKVSPGHTSFVVPTSPNPPVSGVAPIAAT